MNVGFVVSLIAGLSTLLGIIPIFFNFKNINKLIAGGLAFAGGVMLFVSIMDLIPESISFLKFYYEFFYVCLFSFCFIVIGIFVSFLIDSRVGVYEDNGLYRVGIISMIVIILHNIPEGIITFVSTTRDVALGVSLAVAIALHNIPEGISISIPIYYATGSKVRAIFYTFVSGISEFIGAVITYFFLYSYINQIVLGFLYSFIGGIMMYICFFELVPSSFGYGYIKVSIIWFIFGGVFMLLFG